MNNNQKFYRYSNIDKKTLNQLDTFIQSSLDKYQYCDYPKEKFDIHPEFSKLLTSYKSQVPDLVIFNKKFNKNLCFINSNTIYNNPFPRAKFSLKTKNHYPTSTNINSNYETHNDDYYETVNLEEEDPQWLDYKVEDMKDSKIDFQSIPIKGKEAKENNIKEENKGEKVVVNVEKENLNGDLLKQLESFFEVKQETSKDSKDAKEKRAVSDTEKEKVSASATSYNTTNRFNKRATANTVSNPVTDTKTDVIINEHWQDSLNLFKQHYSLYENEDKKEKESITTTTVKQISEKEVKSETKDPFEGIIPTTESKETKEEKVDVTSKHIEEDSNKKSLDIVTENFTELMNKFQTISSNIGAVQEISPEPISATNTNLQHLEDNFSNLKNLFENNNKEDISHDHENSLDHHLINDIEIEKNVIDLIGEHTDHLDHADITELSYHVDIPSKGDEEVKEERKSVKAPSNDTSSLQQSSKSEDNINIMSLPVNKPLEKADSGNLTRGNSDSLSQHKLNIGTTNFFNSLNYLENPIIVVTKNIFHKGWIITFKDTEKVINCFNSFDLFAFYDNELKNGRSIDELYATDYESDICFQPKNLYETIRDNLDSLKKKRNEQLFLMHNQLIMNKMALNMNKSMKDKMTPTQGGNQQPNQQTHPIGLGQSHQGSQNNRNLLNQGGNPPSNIPGLMTKKANSNSNIASSKTDKEQQPKVPTPTSNTNTLTPGFANPIMNGNYQSFFQYLQSMQNVDKGDGVKMDKNQKVNKEVRPPNVPQMQQMQYGLGRGAFPGMMQQIPYGMVGNPLNGQIPLNLNLNFNIVNNDIKMNNIMVNSHTAPSSKQTEKSEKSKSSSNLNEEASKQSTETSNTQKTEPESKKEISKAKEYLRSIGNPPTTTTSSKAEGKKVVKNKK